MSYVKKLLLSLSIFSITLVARDLNEIKSSGYITHLGVPYANFVTGLGDGLDIELMKGFANYLGVEYRYKKTSWNRIFGDLTGENVKYDEKEGIVVLNRTDVIGDVIASGLTILPWREKVVNFSIPTFPSSVWVIAKVDSKVTPINPSATLEMDIKKVKEKIAGQTVLTRPNTCLDGRLYELDKTDAHVKIHPNSKQIIEMVPSVIQNQNDLTLLDVPDALLALEKWSGEIKVIGPISQEQLMGVAFRKDSLKLREEFNNYFLKIKKDGTYKKIVEKYYPSIFLYYSSFFE